MALPAGVYIIENVQNRNWAILTNDNDGDDVLSGTDADTNSGNKWEIRRLHNGTYLLRNQQFRNHASYKLTDNIEDYSSVLSIRTGDPQRWRINHVDGFYWISDLDRTRWTLKYDHHDSPITLEKYTHSNNQHWKIVSEDEASVLIATPRFSDRSQPNLRKCPPPTRVFIGRRDILSIMHEYFSTDIGKRHIFILIGLGGVGKSQLSLKFIEECQVDTKPSRFSDVFFIDATSAETINDDLRNIALVKRSGDSAEDGLRWLSRQNGEWLLYFDNADNTTLNLLDYFPCSSNGNIIVTTRNNETRIHAPRSSLNISGLTHDDAITLLLDISGVRDPSDENMLSAKTIVKELGYLALAIIQAGAYISKSGCSLVRYIEMYRERRIGFLEEYRENVQRIDNYEWTVYTTWAVSFEKLSIRAATFLKICAFLHHDGISVELFQRASANIGTRILRIDRVSEGLAIAKDFLDSFRSEGQWDLHEFLIIIMEIRSYSLIDFDERNETYSIHPLVHAWTRSRVTDATIFHESSQYILDMSIDGQRGSKDIAFRRTLLPHIDASLQGGIVNDPDVVALLWRPYYEGGRWIEAEKLIADVTQMRKEIFGEDHPDTLMGMSNLARTYCSQGRWKDSEDLQSRVMEISKKVLGEEHPDTPASMTNLAVTYMNQGRWSDAEKLEARVFRMSKHVLGEDHPDTLMSQANLAATYTNQGRWVDSEELEMQVMEMRVRLLGEEHPDTLTSIGNLAVTYRSQGRMTDAEELEVRVVELKKRILGEEHPSTLVSLANHAVTYRCQGRWTDAEELEVHVMETSKRVLGEEHPHTLSIMANLAATYSCQGRLANAEELQVRVMETRKRILGEEHHSTLSSMANLAATYRCQGRWSDAEELEVQVMEVRKRVLGEDHPDTIRITAYLAVTYWRQGRWTDSEELGMRATEMSERVLGEEHPDTLTRMADLAATYRSRGRSEHAKQLLVRVVETSKTVLGDDHPDTLARMADLSLIAEDQSLYESS